MKKIVIIFYTLGISGTITAMYYTTTGNPCDKQLNISQSQKNNLAPSLKQPIYSEKESLINSSSSHYTHYGLHNILLSRKNMPSQK